MLKPAYSQRNFHHLNWSIEENKTPLGFSSKRTKDFNTEKTKKDQRYNYLNKPKKLLVKDKSTRPTQLQMKNGRESQDGLLIPTINWRAGRNKQELTLRQEPSMSNIRQIKSAFEREHNFIFW